ncbi:MAG: GNAT family N-acetyltransferase [Anaerolineae bacterium]|nr:GNAT family N-acetyltransferase [Anaerolineae bacterium]
MTVTLKPITKDNFQACITLKVNDDQKMFVAPNLYSIAQGQFTPGTQMRGIYADDTLVGFVMWTWDNEDHDPPEMWLWRFMIGGDYQGQGYGRAAMQHVIALLKIEGVTELFLSYEPENTGGAQFYAGLGFADTGRVEGGEIVVKLDLTEEQGV